MSRSTSGKEPVHRCTGTPEHLLQEAYRYCAWITYRHYENFPVASWLLPRKIRPHVAAVYAFARSADDFADEARYRGRSLELLDLWRKTLWACAKDGAGEKGKGKGETPFSPVSFPLPLLMHPIFTALADTIRRRGLPVQLFEDLLTAFSMDVTRRRYADWEELLGYCRYSANPIGRLVLLLFGIRQPRLHHYSDRICTALQLANHWQDLKVDLARDMIYVPQDLMEKFGVGEAELKSYGDQSPRRLTPSFRALMRELVGRARALFEEGEPLVGALQGGLRLEIQFTLLGGRAILDRVEAADYDVFTHRPTLSGWDKVGLLLRAVLS